MPTVVANCRRQFSPVVVILNRRCRNPDFCFANFACSTTVRDRPVFKMPGASVQAPAAPAPAPATASPTPASRKTSLAPERKYKCQFCARAFSRSEHRSRHERSRTYFSTISYAAQLALRSWDRSAGLLYLMLHGMMLRKLLLHTEIHLLTENLQTQRSDLSSA